MWGVGRSFGVVLRLPITLRLFAFGGDLNHWTSFEKQKFNNMQKHNLKNETPTGANNVLAVRLISEFVKDDQNKPYWVNLKAGVTGEYYRTSWNWLMPVLEKICRLKIGDGIETVDYPNLRTFGMINEETGGIMVRLNGFQVFESDTLIKATFLAVVDFLEWQSKADR